MSPQRIDRLTSPPVVGELYLVPTIRFYAYGGVSSWWPVIGPRHEDKEHLDFEHLHYHVDVRFLSPTQQRLMRAHDRSVSVETVAARVPISNCFGDPPAPHPTFRELRCRAINHSYPSALAGQWDNFRQLWVSYAGQTCKRGKGGFVCPHRHFPLGSIAPVSDVITCPLHGLRIDAASGHVLPLEA